MYDDGFAGTNTPKPHASLPYLEDAAADVSEDRGKQGPDRDHSNLYL